MKKILSLAFVLISAVSVFGQYKINNIFYELNGDKTATVTYKFNEPYSGDIVIPETVNYGDDWDYTVTVIGDEAFQTTKDGITSISLPNTLKKIRANAFYDCKNLTKLTIPASVDSIGKFFLNGSGVTELTILATSVPKTDAKTFGVNFATAQSITLYVPKGCKEAYEKAWSGFKDIVELSDEDDNDDEDNDNDGNDDIQGAAPSIANAAIQISVANGKITVNNAKDVTILNIMGEKVASGNISYVSPSGVYIVIADGKVFKVFVK